MSKTNKLVNSTSPYLLQHQENPVDWYPWGQEAFDHAKADDKPIFLSIGYSTCHWCHVMAHECFEDAQVAELLNKHYICIKVDKEERPDIDSTYMSICVALTGSGGWPMTIIMDSSGNPFFAGTYFPKKKRYGMPGLMDILQIIHQKWTSERETLLESANAIVEHMSQSSASTTQDLPDSEALIDQGIAFFTSAFDPKHGGFGRAPKFPSPHNLLFLMNASQVTKNKNHLAMAEKTLMQIAKGGIFDHIGFGFSRYSTDGKWLAPHFEKMLYDNALLIMAYTKAFEITQNPVYKAIVQKTIDYITREMTNAEGGFYSAQDADTQGVEGKYYVFTPDEIISLLGQDEGRMFCMLYDITTEGNFEEQSIPNQLHLSTLDDRMADALSAVYHYRKQRYPLHKDDKILTAWNALMIAALCEAALAFDHPQYLDMAKAAAAFIETHLCQGRQVFASFRDGKRSDSGFIDDYAFYIYSLLKLYSATLDASYLSRAHQLAQETIADFYDVANGGFYLYANGSEALVLRPKETYDGAIPSGNSVMTMNMILLSQLVGDEFSSLLDQQISFMTSQIADHAASSAFFLYALLKKDFPDAKITAVIADPKEKEQVISTLLHKGMVTILDHETDEYKLLNNRATYYVCNGHVCQPPTNEL